jgi:hypothetical protein
MCGRRLSTTRLPPTAEVPECLDQSSSEYEVDAGVAVRMATEPLHRSMPSFYDLKTTGRK